MEPTDPSPQRRLLAPVWHTAVLVAILLATAATGFLFQARGGPGPGPASSHRGALSAYVSALVLDWLLFYFVWVFCRKRGTSLRELVGGRWSRPADVARDVAIAIPFWFVWQSAAQLLHRFAGPSAARSIEVLLPRTALETGVWLLVSLTAGFTEEVIFRGYLQKQLRALTGSAAVAVVGQALLFGVAHGYQGWKNVAVIAPLGVLFGLLALWRRSTRPGMISHAWTDVYGGLRLGWLSRWF